MGRVRKDAPFLFRAAPATADKLHNNIDAAEYKHVVLLLHPVRIHFPGLEQGRDGQKIAENHGRHVRAELLVDRARFIERL